MRLLDEALAVVAAGRFAVVEICGEPGIGKTRMLDELGRRAAAAGLPVYIGRSTEFEQEVPFAMYTEALDRLVRTALTPRAARGAVDRFQVYAEVRRRLANAGRPGLVLLLDDVHWADRASLELTEHLIHKPPGIAMVVAITFRPGRAPGRLIAAIARHSPATIRMTLPPLGPADLEALLPDTSERRRDLVMRASRGNPLYLQAVSRLTDEALVDLLAEHDPNAGAGLVHRRVRERAGSASNTLVGNRRCTRMVSPSSMRSRQLYSEMPGSAGRKRGSLGSRGMRTCIASGSACRISREAQLVSRLASVAVVISLAEEERRTSSLAGGDGGWSR